MLTVVAKLFHIVAPDVAVFGQKDLQQATLVRRMVSELDFPLQVRVAPTVRDSDGLALSSRNRYLSVEDRRAALALPRALRAVADAYSRGETDAGDLTRTGTNALARETALAIDYFAVVESRALTQTAVATNGDAVIAAVRVGRTRLIDNVLLGTLG